jgi:hypothetical protein
VEILKDSSMEISENNDVINIDLVKIESGSSGVLEAPQKMERCALKFSPKNKEILKNNVIDIDVESFKNQYLNEVDRDFKNGNHTIGLDKSKNETKATRKRKLKRKSMAIRSKRRRISEVVLNYDHTEKKKKKKKGTSLSITNDDMQVKIRLKKKKFRLKIMQGNDKAPKSLKQYVLKYSAGSPSKVIEKPDKDITPIKRKHVKLQKSPDNLKQTSLHNFFKTKTPVE